DGENLWVMNPDEEQIQQADRERLGEDLRLLYVALTRARHACWLGLADLRRGNSKSSVLHEGALAWLLGGGERLSSPEGLTRWLAGWKDIPGITIGPAPDASDDCYQPEQPDNSALHERTPQHAPFEPWWI